MEKTIEQLQGEAVDKMIDEVQQLRIERDRAIELLTEYMYDESATNLETHERVLSFLNSVKK